MKKIIYMLSFVCSFCVFSIYADSRVDATINSVKIIKNNVLVINLTGATGPGAGLPTDLYSVVGFTGDATRPTITLDEFKFIYAMALSAMSSGNLINVTFHSWATSVSGFVIDDIQIKK
jgi:hypothetical protein